MIFYIPDVADRLTPIGPTSPVHVAGHWRKPRNHNETLINHYEGSAALHNDRAVAGDQGGSQRVSRVGSGGIEMIGDGQAGDGHCRPAEIKAAPGIQRQHSNLRVRGQ